MALTAAEKTSIKRHLGLNVTAQSLYPFLPVWFQVEDILSTLPTESENEARTILGRLTALESQIDGAKSRLKAVKLGTIELPGYGELAALWREVMNWRRELSTLVGVPMQPRGGHVMVS